VMVRAAASAAQELGAEGSLPEIEKKVRRGIKDGRILWDRDSNKAGRRP
jgi:hypothetical protein